jgi:hypothetical protein
MIEIVVIESNDLEQIDNPHFRFFLG